MLETFRIHKDNESEQGASNRTVSVSRFQGKINLVWKRTGFSPSMNGSN